LIGRLLRLLTLSYIKTHTNPRKKEINLWEGYPTEFLFLLNEYLYIGRIVGEVIPAPTNP
jgi:hypothetical protein